MLTCNVYIYIILIILAKSIGQLIYLNIFCSDVNAHDSIVELIDNSGRTVVKYTQQFKVTATEPPKH